MNAAGKSSFAGLVSYLSDDQGVDERVAGISVMNCDSVPFSDDIDDNALTAAVAEVMATQQQNTRAKGDKTYHLLFSFAQGEDVSKEGLAAIEQRLCDALGFSEHQRVSVTHRDTDCLHVHVAINKIHPTKLTMHEPYQSFRKMAQVCADVESSFGLSITNHEFVRSVSEGRVADMEAHSGIESLSSYIKRTSAGDLKKADTWATVHAVLNANGVSLKKRGAGLVFESGGVTVKASTVDRGFSKQSLELKLGEFQTQGGPQREPIAQNLLQGIATALAMPVMPGYVPIPVPDWVVKKKKKDALYQQYREERELAINAQNELYTLSYPNEMRSAVKDSMRGHKTRLGLIRLFGDNAEQKRFLARLSYRAMRKDIDAKARSITSTQQTTVSSHRHVAVMNKRVIRRVTWADWLVRQAQAGNKDALELLRSQAAQRKKRATARVRTAERVKDFSSQAAHAQQPRIAKGLNDVENIIYATDNIFDHDIELLNKVTKNGTIIQKPQLQGRPGLRFVDKGVVVSNPRDSALMEAAFNSLASGSASVEVKGSPVFKASAIRYAAASPDKNITFSDIQLEALKQKTMKEFDNDDRSRGRFSVDRSGAGRTGSRGAGARDRGAAGSNGAIGSNGKGRRGRGCGTHTGNPQPNVRGVRIGAPPENRDRVRTLSQLGVVRIASGSEVLLPRDVPGNVEQQRTDTNNAVRRSNDGRVKTNATDVISQGRAAAEKYIKERNDKKAQGMDILNHILYDATIMKSQQVVYRGHRNVDNSILALFEVKGDEHMQVLPVDKKTLSRLRRVKLGSTITLTKAGGFKIKSKGVSR